MTKQTKKTSKVFKKSTQNKNKGVKRSKTGARPTSTKLSKKPTNKATKGAIKGQVHPKINPKGAKKGKTTRTRTVQAVTIYYK